MKYVMTTFPEVVIASMADVQRSLMLMTDIV